MRQDNDAQREFDGEKAEEERGKVVEFRDDRKDDQR